MTEIQRTPPLTLVNQVPAGTVWQHNAHTFATTAQPAIDAERHDGVRRALAYIEKGMPGRAHYELARSVTRQARIAGLGTPTISPLCPCGRSGDHS